MDFNKNQLKCNQINNKHLIKIYNKKR